MTSRITAPRIYVRGVCVFATNIRPFLRWKTWSFTSRLLMNSLVPHLRCWEVPDGCTKTSSLFTLFVDGENEVGKVTSVTLPKLTRKTDSYRGGGMMGAVSIDLGLDDSALDASFVMGAQFVSCS